MKVFALIILALLSSFCGGTDTGGGGGASQTKAAQETKEISAAEAAPEVAKAYSQFVDVRTVEEYTSGHAARAVNIPIDTLSNDFARLEKNEPVYLICETGNRSKKAAAILQDAGFKNVMSIKGGTQAWKAAGLPMENKPPHNVPDNKK